MKRIVFAIIALSFILIFNGCRNSSPKVQTPVALENAMDLPADMVEQDTTPKVDILFVIDYSTSMFNHQVNLAKNINQFVKSFENNKTIDFHMGMLPIYDTWHFGNLETNPNRHTMVAPYPLGELLKLKDPTQPLCDFKNDPACKVPPVMDGPRFVTRDTPDYLGVLERTILMGEQLGPAYEEMFSPIMPALTQPDLVSGVNGGFYRADANLIIVFITDGDDGTDRLSAGELAQSLFALKGGDTNKVSVVGVLSPTKETGCAKDAGAPGGPVKIEELLRLTHSEKFELSLCSPNFGDKLAQIGSDLSVKVERQSIEPKKIPDFGPGKTLTVYFGTQLLNPATSSDPDSGWSYDPNPTGWPRVSIGSKTALKPEAGAKFKIQFTPISASNMVNGRVTTE